MGSFSDVKESIDNKAQGWIDFFSYVECFPNINMIDFKKFLMQRLGLLVHA